jgi:hypothetical protein
MDPEELDRIMSSWDVEVQGKKPHLLYTIPCAFDRRFSIADLALTLL